MKEIPMLFSAPMVRALLEDRKTMIRRVIDQRNSFLSPGGDWSKLCWDGSEVYREYVLQGFYPPFINQKAPLPFVDSSDPNWHYLHVPYRWAEDQQIYRIYPRVKVGDRIWVKETHAFHPSAEEAGHPIVFYKARGDILLGENKWRPSIFMPRWASRITLEVTRVGAERIQEITEEDATAEGVEYQGGLWRDYQLHTQNWLTTARESFKSLWDSLSAKRGYGWDKNPWVWVIEFKKVEAWNGTELRDGDGWGVDLERNWEDSGDNTYSPCPQRANFAHSNCPSPAPGRH